MAVSGWGGTTQYINDALKAKEEEDRRRAEQEQREREAAIRAEQERQAQIRAAEQQAELQRRQAMEEAARRAEEQARIDQLRREQEERDRESERKREEARALQAAMQQQRERYQQSLAEKERAAQAATIQREKEMEQRDKEARVRRDAFEASGPFREQEEILRTTIGGRNAPPKLEWRKGYAADPKALLDETTQPLQILGSDLTKIATGTGKAIGSGIQNAREAFSMEGLPEKNYYERKADGELTYQEQIRESWVDRVKSGERLQNEGNVWTAWGRRQGWVDANTQGPITFEQYMENSAPSVIAAVLDGSPASEDRRQELMESYRQAVEKGKDPVRAVMWTAMKQEEEMWMEARKYQMLSTFTGEDPNSYIDDVARVIDRAGPRLMTGLTYVEGLGRLIGPKHVTPGWSHGFFRLLDPNFDDRQISEYWGAAATAISNLPDRAPGSPKELLAPAEVVNVLSLMAGMGPAAFDPDAPTFGEKTANVFQRWSAVAQDAYKDPSGFMRLFGGDYSRQLARYDQIEALTPTHLVAMGGGRPVWAASAEELEVAKAFSEYLNPDGPEAREAWMIDWLAQPAEVAKLQQESMRWWQAAQAETDPLKKQEKELLAAQAGLQAKQLQDKAAMDFYYDNMVPARSIPFSILFDPLNIVDAAFGALALGKKILRATGTKAGYAVADAIPSIRPLDRIDDQVRKGVAKVNPFKPYKNVDDAIRAAVTVPAAINEAVPFGNKIARGAHHFLAAALMEAEDRLLLKSKMGRGNTGVRYVHSALIEAVAPQSTKGDIITVVEAIAKDRQGAIKNGIPANLFLDPDATTRLAGTYALGWTRLDSPRFVRESKLMQQPGFMEAFRNLPSLRGDPTGRVDPVQFQKEFLELLRRVSGQTYGLDQTGGAPFGSKTVRLVDGSRPGSKKLEFVADNGAVLADVDELSPLEAGKMLKRGQEGIKNNRDWRGSPVRTVGNYMRSVLSTTALTSPNGIAHNMGSVIGYGIMQTGDWRLAKGLVSKADDSKAYVASKLGQGMQSDVRTAATELGVQHMGTGTASFWNVNLAEKLPGIGYLRRLRQASEEHAYNIAQAAGVRKAWNENTTRVTHLVVKPLVQQFIPDRKEQRRVTKLIENAIRHGGGRREISQIIVDAARGQRRLTLADISPIAPHVLSADSAKSIDQLLATVTPQNKDQVLEQVREIMGNAITAELDLLSGSMPPKRYFWTTQATQLETADALSLLQEARKGNLISQSDYKRQVETVGQWTAENQKLNDEFYSLLLMTNGNPAETPMVYDAFLAMEDIRDTYRVQQNELRLVAKETMDAADDAFKAGQIDEATRLQRKAQAMQSYYADLDELNSERIVASSQTMNRLRANLQGKSYTPRPRPTQTATVADEVVGVVGEAADAAPDNWMPGDSALWRTDSGPDFPVKLEGIMGRYGDDVYWAVEGSSTGIPQSQLVNPRTASQAASPVPPSPTVPPATRQSRFAGTFDAAMQPTNRGASTVKQMIRNVAEGTDAETDVKKLRSVAFSGDDSAQFERKLQLQDEVTKKYQTQAFIALQAAPTPEAMDEYMSAMAWTRRNNAAQARQVSEASAALDAAKLEFGADSSQAKQAMAELRKARQGWVTTYEENWQRWNAASALILENQYSTDLMRALSWQDAGTGHTYRILFEIPGQKGMYAIENTVTNERMMRPVKDGFIPQPALNAYSDAIANMNRNVAERLAQMAKQAGIGPTGIKDIDDALTMLEQQPGGDALRILKSLLAENHGAPGQRSIFPTDAADFAIHTLEGAAVRLANSIDHVADYNATTHAPWSDEMIRAINEQVMPQVDNIVAASQQAGFRYGSRIGGDFTNEYYPDQVMGMFGGYAMWASRFMRNTLDDLLTRPSIPANIARAQRAVYRENQREGVPNRNLNQLPGVKFGVGDDGARLDIGGYRVFGPQEMGPGYTFGIRSPVDRATIAPTTLWGGGWASPQRFDKYLDQFNQATSWPAKILPSIFMLAQVSEKLGTGEAWWLEYFDQAVSGEAVEFRTNALGGILRAMGEGMVAGSEWMAQNDIPGAALVRGISQAMTPEFYPYLVGQTIVDKAVMGEYGASIPKANVTAQWAQDVAHQDYFPQVGPLPEQPDSAVENYSQARQDTALRRLVMALVSWGTVVSPTYTRPGEPMHQTARDWRAATGFDPAFGDQGMPVGGKEIRNTPYEITPGFGAQSSLYSVTGESSPGQPLDGEQRPGVSAVKGEFFPQNAEISDRQSEQIEDIWRRYNAGEINKDQRADELDKVYAESSAARDVLNEQYPTMQELERRPPSIIGTNPQEAEEILQKQALERAKANVAALHPNQVIGPYPEDNKAAIPAWMEQKNKYDAALEEELTRILEDPAFASEAVGGRYLPAEGGVSRVDTTEERNAARWNVPSMTGQQGANPPPPSHSLLTPNPDLPPHAASEQYGGTVSMSDQLRSMSEEIPATAIPIVPPTSGGTAPAADIIEEERRKYQGAEEIEGRANDAKERERQQAEAGAWGEHWDAYRALGDDWAAKRQYMLDNPDFAKYYEDRYGSWWSDWTENSARTWTNFSGGGWGGGGWGGGVGRGRLSAPGNPPYSYSRRYDTPYIQGYERRFNPQSDWRRYLQDVPSLEKWRR